MGTMLFKQLNREVLSCS